MFSVVFQIVHTNLLCLCEAATPPLYTPVAGLSRVSSSDSVSSLANSSIPSCSALNLNMTVMADLVQEKMNELSDCKSGRNCIGVWCKK